MEFSFNSCQFTSAWRSSTFSRFLIVLCENDDRNHFLIWQKFRSLIPKSPPTNWIKNWAFAIPIYVEKSPSKVLKLVPGNRKPNLTKYRVAVQQSRFVLNYLWDLRKQQEFCKRIKGFAHSHSLTEAHCNFQWKKHMYAFPLPPALNKCILYIPNRDLVRSENLVGFVHYGNTGFQVF